MIIVDLPNDKFLVETNLPTPICQGLCYFTGGYDMMINSMIKLIADNDIYIYIYKCDMMR